MQCISNVKSTVVYRRGAFVELLTLGNTARTKNTENISIVFLFFTVVSDHLPLLTSYRFLALIAFSILAFSVQLPQLILMTDIGPLNAA